MSDVDQRSAASRIRQLPPEVINQIAAGEVVERPASVVQELLENSIDALATRIDVMVEQGGAELIRVVDDGVGIHPDDLPLTVASHATSKITSADDLFRVHTMGFRGEALASIAAVSRLRIRSRLHDADCGYELNVDGGVPTPIQPCGCSPGTAVEVRQLFSHTPVRRKFLRTAGTEFGHITEQFTRIALAHPRLHLTLQHNGRAVHSLPATDHLKERLEHFYGRELTGKLITVESEADGIRLWGYVAHPSQSKANRKGQYLFLNGRWIQDRSLQHALGEAYRGLLMTGRYPIAFLFLEMPPDEVDVNVHPTKAEVRFRDAQRLYRQLLATLRNRFLSSNLESSLRIPQRQLTDQNRSHSENRNADSSPQRAFQLDFVRWAKDQLAAALAPPATSSSAPGPTPTASPRTGLPAETDDAAFSDALSPSTHRTDGHSADRSGRDPSDLTDSESLSTEMLPDIPPQNAAGLVNGSAEARPGTGEEDSGTETPIVPGPFLRVMQIHDCYLVVESKEGLTVIDQHALHERILYEQLRRRVLSGEMESQRLLVPQPLELSAAEANILREETPLLQEVGYTVEDFGGNTLLLSAYPVLLSRTNHAVLLRDIAAQLLNGEKQPDRRDLLDHILHTMACRAAIKAGQRLTPEEMEALLAQRHLVENSHHCPHGRPTALVLSRQELDRQFGRLG